MAVLMLNSVPDDLKAKFKKACASDGRSMAKVANELFERFVEEQEERENYAKMEH